MKSQTIILPPPKSVNLLMQHSTFFIVYCTLIIQNTAKCLTVKTRFVIERDAGCVQFECKSYLTGAANQAPKNESTEQKNTIKKHAYSW